MTLMTLTLAITDHDEAFEIFFDAVGIRTWKT